MRGEKKKVIGRPVGPTSSLSSHPDMTQRTATDAHCRSNPPQPEQPMSTAGAILATAGDFFQSPEPALPILLPHLRPASGSAVPPCSRRCPPNSDAPPRLSPSAGGHPILHETSSPPSPAPASGSVVRPKQATTTCLNCWQ
jgi:hypothetical protein